MERNNIEAVKYNGKKWINEKDLEKALGYKNLAGNKTQYYSNEFKKKKVSNTRMWRFSKFIAEELTIYLILDTKTVKEGELKIKLG